MDKISVNTVVHLLGMLVDEYQDDLNVLHRHNMPASLADKLWSDIKLIDQAKLIIEDKEAGR